MYKERFEYSNYTGEVATDLMEESTVTKNEQRAEIEKHVEEFLKSGGEIKVYSYDRNRYNVITDLIYNPKTKRFKNGNK